MRAFLFYFTIFANRIISIKIIKWEEHLNIEKPLKWQDGTK